MKFSHNPKKLTLTLGVILTALTLSACGGSSGSGSSKSSSNGSTANGSGSTGNGNNTGKPTQVDPNVNQFTQTAQWNFETLPMPYKEFVECFDFDGNQKVDCTTSTDWDVKVRLQGRSGAQFSTNSGINGSGKGGVLTFETGVQPWAELQKYKNATTEPATKQNIAFRYKADASVGIFDQNPWYEYGLNGVQTDHNLYPNNRVYLITSDDTDTAIVGNSLSPVYALQVINYYNEAGQSGHPTLRWIDTSFPLNVQTKTFDASNSAEPIYIDLKTGKTTDKNGEWQVSLHRSDIKLHPDFGGFVARTPEGFYDKQGKPIKDKFFAKNNPETTLSDLMEISQYQKPESTRSWVTQKDGSWLMPAVTGSYFKGLNYGLYTYTGGSDPQHTFIVKPEGKETGALIRSNTGNSYARMKISKIAYEKPNDIQSKTTWTLDFEVQPAS